MSAYYNDNDTSVIAWQTNLAERSLIAADTIDQRSIHDIRPHDLKRFDRCHFFSGIAGWELALQWAGWPPDRPVWTGSCPCQPFSTAGKGLGTDDPRHLWPVWFGLIKECRPATIFGEQVASKAGRGWLAGVFADLESLGYAVAGADLCAAGVVAPHIRQRLFWVADAVPAGRAEGRDEPRGGSTAGLCELPIGMVQPNTNGCESRSTATAANGYGSAVDTAGRVPGGLGNANGGELAITKEQSARRQQQAAPRAGWDDCDIVRCVEPTKEPGRYVEKRRRVESGLVALAHGVPGRVGRLRGFGNAIVPQVAAEFIQAYREAQ